MITVDDHALHVMTAGEGQYTVVFESGFGASLNSWRKVAPEISKRAKVLAYSRAGAGKSAPGKTPHTLEQSVTELGELLQQAGAKPPYILVGHSYGGFVIRGYAATHPNQIAGLVFVDPADEKQVLALRELDPVRAANDEALVKSFQPPQLLADYELLNTRIMATGKLPAFGPLPNVPVALLTSVQAEYPEFFAHSPQGIALHRLLHEQFFRQFSNGNHLVTANSGHNIHQQEPGLVIGAIDQVISSATAQAERLAWRRRQDQLVQQLDMANDLLSAGKTAAAEKQVLAAVKASQFDETAINALGYEFLGKRQLPAIGSLLLKTNTLNYPLSANAFDSYGESLLTLNQAAAAKQQFEQAVALGLAQGMAADSRALQGYRKNLAKAEAALAL
ncbi:MAG: alpha/beta fold hydrolase [Pseudomonadota bacterium]